MVDSNGNIFGIHKEKILTGKGINWCDMVIGKEDGRTGEIRFNLLGNTLP